MVEPVRDGRVPGPGEVLGGKYRVERQVAAGGMGVVLAAEHLRLGHRVAIKVLQPYARAIPEVAGRFEREARAAAQIRSPNVARVIDVEAMPDGSPFMVMEFLEGHDLGAEIDERRKIPPAEAIGYALSACAGMREAHRLGIIHRDLKPSNLFLAVEGGQRTLKVLDFGISKVTGDADLHMTATNSVLGTPLYMSPEQVRSAKNVDARTDIWSLGVILYEMISGELPFEGQSATGIAASIVADEPVPLASRCEGLPAGLADTIMKALEKKPASRYQDVDELATALRPYDGSAASRPVPSRRFVITLAGGMEPTGDAPTLATPAPPAPPAGDTGSGVAIGNTAPPSGPATPAGAVESVAPSAPPSPSLPAPSPPPRAGSRRALAAGALLAAVIGLVGTVRSFRTPDTVHAAPPVEPSSASTVAPPLTTGDAPGLSAQPAPMAPQITPAATASAVAPAGVPSPGRMPRTPASVHAPAPPSVAPPATPKGAPPAVGLPSHI